jgi:hypothetical protein
MDTSLWTEWTHVQQVMSLNLSIPSMKENENTLNF